MDSGYDLERNEELRWNDGSDSIQESKWEGG